MADDIEKLRKKLRWYMYECKYDEYNDQDVNRILSELRANYNEYENNVEKSHIVLNLKSIQSNKKEQHSKRKVIVATFTGIAIAASLFLSLYSNKHIIAGLKNGIFNLIEKNDEGVSYFISPSNVHDNELATYMANEIPEKYVDMIYIPIESINYSLSYIKIKSGDLESVRYDNNKNENYIEIFYNADLKESESEICIIDSLEYEGIKISCYLIENTQDKATYCLSFYYSQNNYRIESNSFEDASLFAKYFIKFIQ